jgi:hypothetical protein
MIISEIKAGEVLVGRYRVERVLGQGGMGIVVQATHLQLQQQVAIKFLLPEVLGNQQVVQRFLREAQAAVRLKSEHVARVIDVGTLESGAPYMVLEYLDGADLASFPRGQLTVGGIINLVLQACEALAEAHSIGIVHRDIKPANFFVTRCADGTLLLKVLDFGISKTSANSGLTATNMVMGTPAYMSPEQMRSSRDVDHRSDIWSLGVVLYELLQGVSPFGGDTFSSVVLKVVSEPLLKLTVRLPGELEAVVYRCLEKDPARRFQNTAELVQALAKYAQSETQAAISLQRTKGIVGPAKPRAALELAPTQRALPSTLSASAGARTMPGHVSRRRSALVAMAATGALAGAAGVVFTVARGGGAETRSPAARSESESNTAPVPAPGATPRSPVATPLPPPTPAVATAPSPSPATMPPPAPTETPPSPGSTVKVSPGPAPQAAVLAPTVQAAPSSSTVTKARVLAPPSSSLTATGAPRAETPSAKHSRASQKETLSQPTHPAAPLAAPTPPPANLATPPSEPPPAAKAGSAPVKSPAPPDEDLLDTRN